MAGNVIKNSLCNGYPGTPSHTPDLVISPHVVSVYEPDGIVPGDLCTILEDGTAVKYVNENSSQGQVFGIAARTVGTPDSYLQSDEKFYPGDVVGIVVRGAVTVPVNQGNLVDKAALVMMGQVCVRIDAYEKNPNAIIGGLETKSTNALEINSQSLKSLNKVVFSSKADENGMVEITILERNMI